jgi:sugar/nucleoside kinase (ribokinase family)
MKRIGIIGAPCIDEIITPDGKTAELALGGVLYSYAAMERFVTEHKLEAEFIPLTFIAKPDGMLLADVYSHLKHFNFDHAPRTDEQTNRVQLVYSDDIHRTEHCPHILPELKAEHLPQPLLASLDGLFVNMISGFDISVETMKYIRSSTKAHIHLDVHALVLGDLSYDPATPRQLRGVKKWRDWMMNVDSVQLNEKESDWLGAPEISSEMELLKQTKQLFTQGGSPKSVIVTRGERGATLFDFSTEKIWDKTPEPVEVRNTTGSGDVFGGVFTVCKTFGTTDYEALWQAETFAAWNTSLVNLEDILSAPL